MSKNLRLSRLAKIALTAGLLFSAAGLARADETRVVFNIPPTSVSVPILVPGVNTATLTTCARSNVGDAGLGQVSLLRTGPPVVMQWVGMSIAENLGPSPKLDAGQSNTLGATITFCDFGGLVAMEVVSGNQIQIHNKDSSAANVVVHFVY